MLVEPINSAIVASTGSILSTYLEKVQRITPFAAWIDDPGQETDSFYPSATPCVDTLANHVPRLRNILRSPPREPSVSLPHCKLLCLTRDKQQIRSSRAARWSRPSSNHSSYFRVHSTKRSILLQRAKR